MIRHFRSVAWTVIVYTLFLQFLAYDQVAQSANILPRASEGEDYRQLLGLPPPNYSDPQGVHSTLLDDISDLKECLAWFVSDEAAKMALKVKNYPPKNERDFEGNLSAFRDKIREIDANPKCKYLMENRDEQADIIRNALRDLPETTRQRLVVLDASQPTVTGDSLHFIHVYQVFSVPNVWDPISMDVVRDLLDKIPYNSNDVIWDGLKNKFIYQNLELEYRVVFLQYLVRFQSTKFFEFFHALEDTIKSKWLVNLNSSDPMTHVEPLDLLQGSLVRAMSSLGTNRITLSKSLHRFLYIAFGLSPDQDPRGANLADIYLTEEGDHRSDPNNAFLICAGKAVNLGLPVGPFFQVSPLTYAIVDKTLIRKANTDGKKVGILCNGKEYLLRSTPVAAAQLSLPEPIDVTQLIEDHGALNVLVTYSLTEETTDMLLGATIAYMKSHGYGLTKIEQQQPTEDAFRRYFSKTDMLVAAAHSVDITRFPLGTRRSRILHFWKRVDGTSPFQKVPVHLIAIFPEKKGETGGVNDPLSLDTLAEHFTERRMLRPQSLLALTLSCHSAGAAVYWTHAYRKSLDLDIAAGRLDSPEHAKDLVQAIAPKGGFPTSLPSDLLLDMVPALKAVDMMAQGQSTRQVFERLSQKFKADWFINAVIQIQRWFKLEVPDVELNLDPVFNLDIPDLLDSTGHILEYEEGTP